MVKIIMKKLVLIVTLLLVPSLKKRSTIMVGSRFETEGTRPSVSFHADDM